MNGAEEEEEKWASVRERKRALKQVDAALFITTDKIRILLLKAGVIFLRLIQLWSIHTNQAAPHTP